MQINIENKHEKFVTILTLEQILLMSLEDIMNVIIHEEDEIKSQQLLLNDFEFKIILEEASAVKKVREEARMLKEKFLE